MPSTDPRVDGYIAKSAAFARPILRHLRALVHRACPAATETMKWGMPHFVHHGILCRMAAFKQHCAFGFWKEQRVFDAGMRARTGALGQLGRITDRASLPPDAALRHLVRTAAALNEAGPAPARAQRPRRAPPRPPADLAAALGANAAARATYAALPPSAQREYVDWLTSAKRPATRARRLAQAVAWLAAGKRRNWQYERATTPPRRGGTRASTTRKRGERP